MNEPLPPAQQEMTTMASAAARVEVLKTETDRFRRYLSDLPDEAWGVQSACERWQVSDVIAHLASAVDNYSGNMARGLNGDSAPPDGAAPPGPSGVAARLEANAQRAIALKDSLGEDLLPTFTSKCADLDQLLAGIGPGDWGTPCYHTAAVISARTYVDLRITEVVVHEWDIRSRLEPGFHLSALALPAVLDLLPVFVVGRLFRPGSGLSGPARFRWDLTGEAPGSYDIVVENGLARMEAASAAEPSVTFTCDASDFALLAYGRINFDTALSDGRISVQGDHDLAAAFAR